MTITKEKISILIAEDHVLIREAWSFILNSDPRFKVIAQCSNGEDAIALACELKPEIIVIDINLPGITGIEAVKQIAKLSPESKILAASQHIQQGYVSAMFSAGARGYITKTSEIDELFTAIIEIHKGGKYICKEIKSRLAEEMLYDDGEKPAAQAKLSPREKSIIDFIRKGISSKEMAECLSITKKTVEVHRYNILRKLNVKNSPELVNYINENPYMLWSKSAV